MSERSPDNPAPPRSPRIVIAGAVDSTRRTFGALLRHRANVVGVLGLDAKAAARTSGYARLDDLAAASGIPYRDFTAVNDAVTLNAVRAWRPDLLFVVGLSQLVGPELLRLPSIACVGFHPTPLPRGRGRAPLAWLTLEGQPGAATFFAIDEGVDSGPVLVQEHFAVDAGDDAAEVSRKLYEAMDIALDRWLPRLLAGEWDPVPQDESRASYYGRRAPDDGCIDWSRSADEICALVRATSRPHPGAYTYVEGTKLLIWKAKPEPGLPWKGVIGRVLLHDTEKGWLVQSGDGLLWLTEVEADPPGEAPLRIGRRLGFAEQDELFRLRVELARLETRMVRLEDQLRGRQS